MSRIVPIVAVVFAASTALGQSTAPRPKFDAFDVATIKLVDSDARSGRFIKLQGDHRFVAKDYSLKLLLAAAYDLTPAAVSGGAAWVETDHYDIAAVTPGDARPSREEQMAMLRTLLTERFKVTFHREQKAFSIYLLEVTKAGSKLKESTAPADDPAALISTVYPDRIVLPARNVTMLQFASLLQRAVLDRPVVDKTSLTGRYSFDLEWAPDDSQFGGDVKPATPEAPSAPFFVAIQQQLGLKLEATRGLVETLVIEAAQKPSAN